MKKILLAVLTLSTLNGFAQKGTKPDVYAKTITSADLKKHLYIVAGAEMEGRETATPGQKKAAAYIETQFKSIGLEPGNNGNYQQFFDVYQDSLINAGLEVNGQPYEFEKDFTVTSSGIAATMKFSEIVLLAPGLIDSLKNMNLSGKLVMMLSNPTPGGRGSTGGALYQTLVSKGVAGIIAPMNPNSRTVLNRKGNQSVSGGFMRAISPQQFFISEKIARAIIGSEYDQVIANLSSVKIYRANILLDIKKNNDHNSKQ